MIKMEMKSAEELYFTSRLVFHTYLNYIDDDISGKALDNIKVTRI